MRTLIDYCENENWISCIDARVKLLFSIVMLGLILSYRGYVFPLLVTGCSIALCLYIKVPLKRFLLRFFEPLFIAAVLVILKFLFSGTDVLVSFNLLGINITGHTDGLRDGIMIAVRILGAVSVVALLGFSTHFTAIMSALSWLRVPKGFIEILMFAYRYIFVIYEDAQVIYTAQKNRLGYATAVRGLGSFGTLTGALVLKAFDRSHALTVSMTQRGYDGNIPLLRHKPFRSSEVIAGLIIICIMGMAWKVL